MDGFRERDRMNRGSADRGSYDRYDRYSRSGRSSYGAPEGVSADEISGIIDDSNAKQLEIIQDFMDDVKADGIDSEKHIISAIDGLSKDLAAKLDSGRSKPDQTANNNKEDIIRSASNNKEELLKAISETRELISACKAGQAGSSDNGEILNLVSSNNDILAGFAEEQLPMLVRGNSSILSQITQTLAENDDILRQILDNTTGISKEIAGISAGSASSAAMDTASPYDSGYSAPYVQDAYAQRTAGPVTDDNSEAILNLVTNNSSILNALRSELATVQQQLRDLETDIENIELPEKEAAPHVDDAAPLDNADTLTKSEADEMYKQLEEHVHSECVKVYRNFQKTLEDQNKAVLDGVGKGGSGARIFALLAFIVGLFNLIVTFLQIYGIL